MWGVLLSARGEIMRKIRNERKLAPENTGGAKQLGEQRTKRWEGQREGFGALTAIQGDLRNTRWTLEDNYNLSCAYLL